MLLDRPIIDRADPTPFPASLGALAKLPQSGRAGNQLPLLGTEDERQLERAILLIIKEAADTGGEDRRLNEAHGALYANGVLRASARCAA